MAAEQGKQQTIMAEGEVKAKLKEMEAQYELQRMQMEFELKAKLIQLQKGIEGQIKMAETSAQMDKEKYKEGS